MIKMGEQWRRRMEGTLASIEQLKGETGELIISEPATINHVEKVEKEIGLTLPLSFKRVLLEFSSRIHFEWYLPETLDLPKKLEEIDSGGCFWSLDSICEFEKMRQDWIADCFSDAEDAYDRVWHNKLSFMNVPNGDMIAFDLKDHPVKTPVVYLSHDDGQGHGMILGEDFEDFMDNWTLLGCPGPEDWQMLPFFSSQEKRFDPYGKNARAWKNYKYKLRVCYSVRILN